MTLRILPRINVYEWTKFVIFLVKFQNIREFCESVFPYYIPPTQYEKGKKRRKKKKLIYDTTEILIPWLLGFESF